MEESGPDFSRKPLPNVISCREVPEWVSLPQPGMGVPGLILDRDGVLNLDQKFVAHPMDFNWVEGAKQLLIWASSEGIPVAIVTNQSGIGAGLYREDDFITLTSWMLSHAPIPLLLYCPHAPEENCTGRKPNPRLVRYAVQTLGLDPAKSLMVGDKPTDIEAAAGAGLRSLKFGGGNLYDQVRTVFDPIRMD
jgi:D-glycero-D-manno-heptose 1,7-bisphosphate phosphatase